MRKMLGEKLRDIREAARLTQKEVAGLANVRVNYYAHIERGEENPTYDKLQDIKKAVKIKSLDLLWGRVTAVTLFKRNSELINPRQKVFERSRTRSTR